MYDKYDPGYDDPYHTNTSNGPFLESLALGITIQADRWYKSWNFRVGRAMYWFSLIATHCPMCNDY